MRIGRMVQSDLRLERTRCEVAREANAQLGGIGAARADVRGCSDRSW